MALQVHYKYKQQVPDESLRKAEGVKVRKKYPAKIPVSFELVRSQRTLVVTSFATSFRASRSHGGVTCEIIVSSGQQIKVSMCLFL